MKVFSIAKGFYRLSKNAPPELSQKEFDHLRALTIYGETKDVKLGVSDVWDKPGDPVSMAKAI